MYIKSEGRKVYVIVLNYKNLRDTLECLESLFRIEYENYIVIFVDNNSWDGSVEGVISWAEGREKADISSECPISELGSVTVEKPIPYCIVGEREFDVVHQPAEPRLVVICSDDNRGYAAGNNKGIRYALAQGGCDYLWILNNDAVVG